MTNQPWQEEIYIKSQNEDYANELIKMVSELSKEQFTAGYKAGREEILKWAEEKKNKRSYAEMCNLSDYEIAKVNGQDNLLEELQNLINKDEK